ncbi:MAG: hypothetical protein QOJ68_3630 [Blastococcus sp.]|jgi:hypothetical protein|nr:hypothetical protein [Blastococcus sp.]
MSATARLPGRPWIRTHRLVLAIALLALVLATTLALLVLRLASAPAATPASGGASTGQPATGGHVPTGRVSEPPLQQIDEGCSIARAGIPC